MPDSASEMLPSTGASSSGTPSGSAAASPERAMGSTVDICATVAERPTPAAIPSGPSVTSRSAAGSDTMTHTSCARPAACAGVSATAAPDSSSGAALSGVRFQTTTS